MRRKAGSALVAVVLLLIAGAITGVAAAKAPKDAGNSPTIVVFPTSQFVQETERSFTWTDRLETLNGDPIEGWEGGHCISLHPDPATMTQVMCDMGFHLEDGDLFATVVINYETVMEERIIFGVTGGTGRFRNARGEIEIVPRWDDPDGSAFAVFRLIGASIDF